MPSARVPARCRRRGGEQGERSPRERAREFAEETRREEQVHGL